MIEDCAKPGEEIQELLKIFSSFISDEISNFNTDLYYQNPDYLEWSYREGKLLDKKYFTGCNDSDSEIPFLYSDSVRIA